MVRKNKKEPYSFSFSPRLIEKLRYWKNTHPDDKLSQQVETFVDALIPDFKK